MNPFIALRDHAKEVYDTLSGNERIKERTRGLYDQVVNRGVKPSFPMLLKDPQNVTMDDLIASGFGVMPMAIKAYHGSPHLFDKFDMSKIGTGEGAQAYGHGLYMAESPDVALGYQKRLAGGDYVDKNGMPIPSNEIASDIYDAARKGGASVKDANNFTNYWSQYLKDGDKMSNTPGYEYIKKVIDGKGIHFRENGNLYETSLQWPDPAREAADPMGPQHFLDWDKPLSEQPESVKNALSNKLLSNNHDIFDWPKGTGKDYYKQVNVLLNGENNALDFFKKQGIPGIRYLDQGSRGAGQGSYNYVVFDDSIPKIVKRNGKAVNSGLPPTQFSKAHETAQRNAALPIEQGGLGLPPDNTAMDRARAMGFDSTAYHTSGSDIKEFIPNKYRGASFFAANPNMSKIGAKAGQGDLTSTGINTVYPVMINTTKIKGLSKLSDDFYKSLPNIAKENEVIKLIGNNNWNDFYKYDDINDLYYKKPLEHIDYNTASKIRLDVDNNPISDWADGYEKYSSDKAKKEGYTGYLQNDEGGVSLAVTDPSQIRSRFAAFDPFKRNSADILATGIMGSLLLNELKNRNAQDKPRYR